MNTHNTIKSILNPEINVDIMELTDGGQLTDTPFSKYPTCGLVQHGPVPYIYTDLNVVAVPKIKTQGLPRVPPLP